MRAAGIQVFAVTNISQKVEMRYADTFNFGFSLSENQICDAASKQFIENATNINVVSSDFTTHLDKVVVQETSNCSFHYKPSEVEKQKRQHIIIAKRKASTLTFRIKIYRNKSTAQRRDYSNYTTYDVDCSKQYTLEKDNSYSRKDNIIAKEFSFSVFCEHTSRL